MDNKNPFNEHRDELPMPNRKNKSDRLNWKDKLSILLRVGARLTLYYFGHIIVCLFILYIIIFGCRIR